jgi:4-aminobutyrate aminotransferase/(S)-3-amino-2-methylpropionate transaminase
MDEIQTGFGRTGEMFGFRHAGIEPDLITLAKSLAGGFPLSAVTGKAEIMDAPSPGGLGGTYGGNGVACAAALAVLDAFAEERLVEHGAARAAQLHAGLLDLQQRHAAIGEVRGLGFMLALEFVKDRSSKTPDAELTQRVIDEARKGGLLVIKCGVNRNVLRFLAPLVTSEGETAEALSILDAAIAKAAAAPTARIS